MVIGLLHREILTLKFCLLGVSCNQKIPDREAFLIKDTVRMRAKFWDNSILLLLFNNYWSVY
jgi:hypothetical protein